MFAINPAHRCELCPQPAYHQTWSVAESRWLQLCHEHKDITDVVPDELVADKFD
jgi:hypothetical protein